MSAFLHIDLEAREFKFLSKSKMESGKRGPNILITG